MIKYYQPEFALWQFQYNKHNKSWAADQPPPLKKISSSKSPTAAAAAGLSPLAKYATPSKPAFPAPPSTAALKKFLQAF